MKLEKNTKQQISTLRSNLVYVLFLLIIFVIVRLARFTLFSKLQHYKITNKQVTDNHNIQYMVIIINVLIVFSHYLLLFTLQFKSLAVHFLVSFAQSLHLFNLKIQ